MAHMKDLVAAHTAMFMHRLADLYAPCHSVPSTMSKG